jgi:beta-glucanase (GH16 family)
MLQPTPAALIFFLLASPILFAACTPQSFESSSAEATVYEPSGPSEIDASSVPAAQRQQGLAEAKIREFTAYAADLILEGSPKTPIGEPFVLADAIEVPTLTEGGFADEPAFIENFGADWEQQTEDWQRATWRQNETQMAKNRAVTNDDGHLVLTVKGGEPPRGGSIQSTREFGYGRWIARVRPSSVPGVLNSVFTKDWDDLTNTETGGDGRKAEVDIEFLTHTFGQGKGEVHLAIHLIDKHPLWRVDIPLDFNPADAFREWGFDILPKRVVWHVDGKILFAWAYTDDYFIHEEYEFFFNAWTNQPWIQGPPTEDAAYHIDWLKFYPLQP